MALGEEVEPLAQAHGGPQLHLPRRHRCPRTPLSCSSACHLVHCYLWGVETVGPGRGQGSGSRPPEPEVRSLSLGILSPL
jgi:hypothetical protein